MKQLMTVLGFLVAVLPLFGAVELRLLSKPEGLSDGQVNVLFQDSTGYMWIGTQRAVDRFDGNNIRTYLFPDDDGNNSVRDITELRRDEIYVGSSRGLFVIDICSHL